MAYPNQQNYNFNRQQYRNGNYNAPYNQNYRGNNQNRPQYKKSGATYTKISKGKMTGFTAVNAWKKTKNGLITASVMPYSDVIVESGRGKQYLKYIAEIVHKGTGSRTIYPCLMNIQTQVIKIKELGMCITPNGSGTTASGKRVKGYFGTFSK